MSFDYLEELQLHCYINITRDQLNELLVASECLIEESTIVGEFIRLLQINNKLILQEANETFTVFLRSINSIAEAKLFIQSRQDTYEKMWDGCGCRVDYKKGFSPSSSEIHSCKVLKF